MSDRELLTECLEALTHDAAQRTFAGGVRMSQLAIKLRAHLAAPQPEPVAVFDGYLGHPVMLPGAPILGYEQPLFIEPPAAEPEPEQKFDHSIGADRFKVVRGIFWWHIKIGDSPTEHGKFRSSGAAQKMADDLLREFRNGAFVQNALAAPEPEKRHPGYILGNHWLETAYSRVCAGEAEADVLRDCGWERVGDAEALRRDAERYNELLMAFGMKHPGETRHETALRYLNQAERCGDERGCDAAMEPAMEPAIRAREDKT